MEKLPHWVSKPEVRQFLDKLVDRLDREDRSGGGSDRFFRLDAKIYPALANATFDEDRELLWEHVEAMAAWGWIEIKLGKGAPGQRPYECGPSLRIKDTQALRQAADRPLRKKGPAELWREAVRAHLIAPEEIQEKVCRYVIDIPGREASEIVGQLNQLSTLKETPMLLRELSARLFWGQSKVLDNKSALVAALLELPECPFDKAPIQLQAFLPESGFDKVLFIENLVSFDAATRDTAGRFKGHALVFASGFMGGAKRIRSPLGASLYFSSNGSLEPAKTTKLLTWLRTASPIQTWFWGDLDYSGMHILASLRDVFPGTQAWAPGYEPMLKALLAGQGHAPEAAGKALQKSIHATGCPYADSVLLPALREVGAFVDQESF